MKTSADKKNLVAATLMIAGILLFWFNLLYTREDALSRIRHDGVIRIGYAVEAPYIFLDARGKLTGLEYETSQTIADRLSIPRVEWVQTEFGSLISELEAGRFDMISAGMFITSERSKRVNFSEPSFRVRQALLVQSGNPYNLHSYLDVQQNAKVKIAVLRGAIEENLLQQMEIPEARLISVPDALTGRIAVESGVADCLALSLPTIQWMAQQQSLGRTEIAQPFIQPSLLGDRLIGFGGAAFLKGDEGLRKAWNRELAGFVGSPKHILLLTKFGFGEEGLPGSITTEMILETGFP